MFGILWGNVQNNRCFAEVPVAHAQVKTSKKEGRAGTGRGERERGERSNRSMGDKEVKESI